MEFNVTPNYPNITVDLTGKPALYRFMPALYATGE
jgi:hypothetical protein